MTATSIIFLLTGTVAAVVVAVGAALILYRKLQNLSLRADVFEDAIDVPGKGMIFFDENEKFRMANDQARQYLPFLDGDFSKEHCKTLKDFLDYMYDHAVDCDESLKNALDKTADFLGLEGFREVIEWEAERLCLVEARRTRSGRTIVSLRDLSNIKRNEDDFIQLNQHNFELKEAVEATTNGIFVVEKKQDQANQLVFVNKAFSEQAGVKKGRVSGSDAYDILYQFVGDDKWESCRRGLSNGEPVNLEVQKKDSGKIRWFNLRITPVKGEKGKPDLFVGVCTETTEIKEKEAEFFHAQKLEALGKMAAGVAHDFNNILSIIDGYSHIASRGLPEGDAVKAYLDKIRKASARGANLTKRMLTFSRHKIFQEDVVDLAGSLKEQESLLTPLVNASIDFSFQIDDEDIFVDSTADNMMQIVMNLVVNAADSISGKGKLTVSAYKVLKKEMPAAVQKEVEGDVYACLEVTDTGQGIDPAILGRIFDPFFTTKDQGKGTGLGLSMVYGLVKQMGGFIDVKTALGKGTSFYIYMPLSNKTPRKITQRMVEGAKMYNLKGFTVLVAEDEPELLDMVADMMQKLGLTVLKAANGNEALLKQEDHEGAIDLLLTDVVMPELDGLKLAKLYGSLRPNTKVIFMSGYPAAGKSALVNLPGNAPFIAKPIQYESLVKIIVDTLSDGADQPPSEKTPQWASSEVL